ncbi:MAG: TIGR02281 family clan AA aspartic protease [Kangiellaceae bacterium]|nr:TIGR02281 family clan AA aspartic protease [Kangiellaceae bacterium]
MSENNDSQNSYDDQTTTRFGKRMIFVAWIMGLVLLTMFFGAWEEKQHNPNSTPTSARADSYIEVNLKRNRQGHYLSGGKVNGRNALFLLDTGATVVAIPGELEQTYALRRGRQHHSRTANGTTTAYSTTINELSIGDITLYDVPASIIPNMQGEEILLGMSVLKELEFTQKGNNLTLRQHL